MADKPTISSLAVIPKRNSGRRLLTDASAPDGTSLNDYASKENCKYQTVSQAETQIGPWWYMAKVDLGCAYRSVPIKAKHHCLAGLKWSFQCSGTPTYMTDTHLCFGARKSPYIFDRLTKAIH